MAKFHLPTKWDETRKKLYRQMFRDRTDDLIAALIKFTRESQRMFSDYTKEMIEAHLDVIKFILTKSRNENIKTILTKAFPNTP